MTITRFTQGSLFLLLVTTMVGCAEQPVNREYRYSSISRLRIDEQDPLLPDESPDAQERQLKTHKQLIKSHSVLESALGKPGIAELLGVRNAQESGIDVTDWLNKRVRVIVGNDPDTKIMQIQVSSDDPSEAQQLCEAVTTAYLERVVNEERKGLLKRWELLKKTYNRKAEEVRKKREDLHALGKQAAPEQAGLERRDKELAHLAKLVNMLGAELLQLELEMSAGSADRVRLIQKGSLPN